MPYISTHVSGTGQPTSGASPGAAFVVGTEYTLDASTDINVAGEFRLIVDCDAMLANDVLEWRVYKIALSGGTVQLMDYGAFAGADGGFANSGKIVQTDWYSNSLTTNNSLKITLKQTFGTARSIVWTIERRDVLAPTTIGRTLDVSATGEGGVDWANVGGPTTVVDLSGTTIKTTQKVDVDTIKTNPVVNAGTITFPTNATVASTTNITAGIITTASNLTTNNDKTGYALSAAGVTAVWAEVMTGTTTAVQAMRGFLAALLGKASGLDTNAPKYRNLADTKNVIDATTDANGNRSSVTLDLT